MTKPTLIEDSDLAAAARVFGIGRPVTYRPVQGRFETEESVVRSKPWRTGSGAIIVLIEGRTGGVSIEHLSLR